MGPIPNRQGFQAGLVVLGFAQEEVGGILKAHLQCEEQKLQDIMFKS